MSRRHRRKPNVKIFKIGKGIKALFELPSWVKQKKSRSYPVIPIDVDKLDKAIKKGWIPMKKERTIEEFPGGVEIRSKGKQTPMLYKSEKLNKKLEETITKAQNSATISKILPQVLERGKEQLLPVRPLENPKKVMETADYFLEAFKELPFIDMKQTDPMKVIVKSSLEVVEDLDKLYEETANPAFKTRSRAILRSIKPIARNEEVKKTIPEDYLKRIKRIK